MQLRDHKFFYLALVVPCQLLISIVLRVLFVFAGHFAENFLKDNCVVLFLHPFFDYLLLEARHLQFAVFELDFQIFELNVLAID